MKRSATEGINIYYCGREACLPGHFFGPAMRTHYLMHFVFRGRGRYRVGESRYDVKAGEGFLIRPNEITYYEADLTEPWEYAWVAFDGAKSEEMLHAAGLSAKNLVTGILQPESCRLYMEEIIRRFEGGGYHDYEMTGYFYLLFSTIVKTDSGREAVPEQGYLDRAIAYIRHNYSYDIQVTDVARHVGIDRTYLFKIFKSHTGLSPKQYLIQYRVLVAKEMIENTPYNMTEIGLSCGFYDLPSFCKHFKKQEGQTPAAYRKGL